MGVDDLDGLRRWGIDPSEVARNGARILLTQIFTFGFFPADPRPRQSPRLAGRRDRSLSTTASSASSTPALGSGSPTSCSASCHKRSIASCGRWTCWRSAASRSIPNPWNGTFGELVAAYSDLSLDNIDLATARARAGLAHPHPSPANPARPRAVNSVVGDDRKRRAAPRSPSSTSPRASPVHPRPCHPALRSLAADLADGPGRGRHAARRHALAGSVDQVSG